MFDTVLGIPAHPLLIHAAVIFIPLLVAGAIIYPFWPAVRARIRWAVVALAVIAPFSGLFAKLSGQHFRQRLINDKVTSPQGLAKIDQHQSYGNMTFLWTLALAVVTLALLGYAWRASRATPATTGDAADATVPAKQAVPRAYWLAGGVVTVILGAVTGYYVFKTGDTGAHIVWSGY